MLETRRATRASGSRRSGQPEEWVDGILLAVGGEIGAAEAALLAVPVPSRTPVVAEQLAQPLQVRLLERRWREDLGRPAIGGLPCACRSA